jgi:N6-adenosine-specific RNA methylase IME4
MRLPLPAPAPFESLCDGAARCILADPPWLFEAWSGKGTAKNPLAHYACLNLDQIAALPVRSLADPEGCVLILWATAPMLPQAFDLMARWGFSYRSAGAWAKQSRSGRSLAFGTGYIYRSAAEFWLLGTIGKPSLRSRSVRNLIVAPLREHSRKPDQMHADIERLFHPPYVELFARNTRPGWSVWGNELQKFAAPSNSATFGE